MERNELHFFTITFNSISISNTLASGSATFYFKFKFKFKCHILVPQVPVSHLVFLPVSYLVFGVKVGYRQRLETEKSKSNKIQILCNFDGRCAFMVMDMVNDFFA